MKIISIISKVGHHKADTMTGGTYMYIHSYQIHNVLNVYRKLLSHGPGGPDSQNAAASKTNDRISISPDGQRQSIMDKISSEIVARITQTGPKNEFEAALSERLTDHGPPQEGVDYDDPPEFKYTVIDEHNRKITNTLAAQGFSPTSQGTGTKAGDHNGNNTNPEVE